MSMHIRDKGGDLARGQKFGHFQIIAVVLARSMTDQQNGERSWSFRKIKRTVEGIAQGFEANLFLKHHEVHTRQKLIDGNRKLLEGPVETIFELFPIKQLIDRSKEKTRLTIVLVAQRMDKGQFLP